MHSKASVFLLLIVLCGIPVASFAHDGATGVVKDRMEIMKSMAQAMKNIRQMARGKSPIDADKIDAAARDIARHAKRISTLFPEGSGHGPSEASPQIWRDFEGFKDSANRLVEKAGALAAAARSNDSAAIASAYRSVGKKSATSVARLFISATP